MKQKPDGRRGLGGIHTYVQSVFSELPLCVNVQSSCSCNRQYFSPCPFFLASAVVYFYVKYPVVYPVYEQGQNIP